MRYLVKEEPGRTYTTRYNERHCVSRFRDGDLIVLFVMRLGVH